MKTVHELESTIADLREEQDRIIAAAELAVRDLTVEETQRFSQICESLLPEAHAQLKVAKAHKSERDARGAKRFYQEIDAQNGTFTQRGWRRDSHGNGYIALARGEFATDFFRPVCENSVGHFIGAKLFGANRSTPEPIRAAATTGTDSLGGFLLPDLVSGEVVDLARSKSVLVAAGVRVMMMETGTLTIPKLETDATTAIKAENAVGVFSDVVFGARSLQTQLSFAGVKASRELYEDAPELFAEQIGNWLSSAMATTIDGWGLAGTGTAQPLGLLNYTSITSTGSIGAIAFEDLIAADVAIKAANHMPTCCIVHPTIHSDLFTIASGDAVNAQKGWVPRPETLANIAFYPTTNCTITKLILGDFSKFVIGVRTGILIEGSAVAGDAFANHQVWIKATARTAFATLDDGAFHILAGITT